MDAREVEQWLSMASARASTAAANRSNAGRISALEAASEAQSTDIHGLRMEFREFAGEVRQALAQQQRVPWGPLAAAASLVVTIVALLVTLGADGPLQRQERQGIQIDRIQARVDAMNARRFTLDDAKLMEAGLRREIDQIRTMQEAVQSTRFTASDGRSMEDRLRSEIDRLEDRLDGRHPTNSK